MSRISQAIEKQVQQAKDAKDADKLDLALRAQYHYAHSGKEVDTTFMKFEEVMKIDPKYYQYID
jgi:hypothetical protein